MKSYKEWQEELSEIAIPEGGMDWRYLYRVMGQRGNADPTIISYLQNITKRLSASPKYQDDPDGLLSAIINAAIFAVRPEVTTRNWSTSALGNMLSRADRIAQNMAGEEGEE